MTIKGSLGTNVWNTPKVAFLRASVSSSATSSAQKGFPVRNLRRHVRKRSR